MAPGAESQQPDPAVGDSDLRELVGHFRARRYDEMAVRLRSLRTPDDLAITSSLRAVRHLCLICKRYREDRRRHKEAVAWAQEREQVLRKQIADILAQMGAQEFAEAIAQASSTPPPEKEGLLQHIRGLFSREPQPPATGETLPSLEEESQQTAAPDTAPPEAEGGPSADEARRPRFRRIEPARRLSPERWRRHIEAEPKEPEPGDEDASLTAADVEPGAPAIALPAEKAAPGQPSLVVYCLGQFQVYLDEKPIEEWPSGKGKSVLKYLVTHRARPVPKEILMEHFWPEAGPDAARNNLNVAIYGLRQALRAVDSDFSHVLFEEDRYLLNPRLHVWVDVEAFASHFAAAQKLEQQSEEEMAMNHYRAAEALYRGEFLAEDRYEEWLLARRQQLQRDYLYLLDRLSKFCLAREDYDGCVAHCDKILAVDPSWEEAHYRLILCYSRQGQRYLALRQYHQCARALAEELGDVQPNAEIQELYERLRGE